MPTVEGTLVSADGYWRVDVVRHGRNRFYRVTYANTVLLEYGTIGIVEHMLGDAFATLQPADPESTQG